MIKIRDAKINGPAEDIILQLQVEHTKTGAKKNRGIILNTLLNDCDLLSELAKRLECKKGRH